MLAEYCYDFIMAGLTGYRRQLERAETGICPLYGPRDWDRESRRKKKILAISSWYRPHDVVMFVPATPGSEHSDQEDGSLMAKVKALLYVRT